MRLILALFALSLIPSLAFAEPSNCGPMDQIRHQLSERYGEVEIRQGVSDKGWLLHLFVEPTGKTWTVVLEQPGQDIGCIADAGKDFAEPQPAEEGDGI